MPRWRGVLGRQLDGTAGHQLAEGRADVWLEAARSTRAGAAAVAGIGPITVEAVRRHAIQRPRTEMDLAVRRSAERRRRTAPASRRTPARRGRRASASRRRGPSGVLASRASISASGSPRDRPRATGPGARTSSPKRRGSERASPAAGTTGRARLQHVARRSRAPARRARGTWSRAARRRRAGRVGPHLRRRRREQIVARQPARAPLLIRERRERVAVVDEQHLDRRSAQLGQRARRAGSC